MCVCVCFSSSSMNCGCEKKNKKREPTVISRKIVKLGLKINSVILTIIQNNSYRIFAYNSVVIVIVSRKQTLFFIQNRMNIFKHFLLKLVYKNIWNQSIFFVVKSYMNFILEVCIRTIIIIIFYLCPSCLFLLYLLFCLFYRLFLFYTRHNPF